MRVYVWSDDGGYGASSVVVAAESEQQARDLVEAERVRLDALMDAKTEAWRARPVGVLSEEWLQTADGKAWTAMPSGNFIISVGGPPTKIVDVNEPTLIDSCWYYE